MLHERFFATGRRASVRKLLNMLKEDLSAEPNEELHIDWGVEKLRRVMQGLGYRFLRIRNRGRIYDSDEITAWRHHYLRYLKRMEFSPASPM